MARRRYCWNCHGSGKIRTFPPEIDEKLRLKLITPEAALRHAIYSPCLYCRGKGWEEF